MVNLAGLLFCMTSKYLARLFRACLSLRTVVASGLRIVHIFLCIVGWVVVYKGWVFACVCA